MRHAFLSLMSSMFPLPERQRRRGAPQPAATRPRAAAPAAGALLALTMLATLAGCSSPKPFQPDLFSTSISPYAHAFNATSAQACEAARRAVLSQGYATSISTSETVDATKGFQPSPENHVSVSFHIVCTPGESSSGNSVLYVNAVQDNYALKKSDTSASVGLSILGSVSLPIRSNNDSMVKISSQTIPPGLFYERFFALVDHYLKTVVRATPVSDADVISSRLAPLPSPKLGNADPAPVVVAASPSTKDTVKPLTAPPPPPILHPAAPVSETSDAAATAHDAASATPPAASATASSAAVAAPRTTAAAATTATAPAASAQPAATAPAETASTATAAAATPVSSASATPAAAATTASTSSVASNTAGAK